MTTNNTPKKVQILSVKDIENEFGLSHVYIQRAIGKLGTLVPDGKVPVRAGSKTLKYVFKRETVEAWRAKCGQRTASKPGTRKFKMYMKEDEAAKLEKLIKDAGLDIEFALANPSK